MGLAAPSFGQGKPSSEPLRLGAITTTVSWMSTRPTSRRARPAPRARTIGRVRAGGPKMMGGPTMMERPIGSKTRGRTEQQISIIAFLIQKACTQNDINASHLGRRRTLGASVFDSWILGASALWAYFCAHFWFLHFGSLAHVGAPPRGSGLSVVPGFVRALFGLP